MVNIFYKQCAILSDPMWSDDEIDNMPKPVVNL